MALRGFVTTATLFSCCLTGLAYPQAKGFGEAQRTYPRTLSAVVPQISLPQNSTNAPPLPPAPTGVIECFSVGSARRATDVEGCRPTLNYLRTFPYYRRIQDFMEGRYPKLPSKPPYAVHSVQSNCAVQIASENPYTSDKFSFEQARALAIEILEFCQDHGGLGGFAPIGRRVGWRVVVVGYKFNPDPPDRTGLFEEIGSGNGTLVPVEIGEA